MITVSISGRKATLLKTEDLPTGNDSSIKVNLIFDNSDPIWKNARKFAVFYAVTPRGLKKRLPAVVTENDECYIPGKIISTPYSKVEIGVMAAYEDGSSVATNIVFLNKTLPGASDDGSFEGCEQPVDKNDFEEFLSDLAASVDSEIVDLQSAFNEYEPILKCLAMDCNGNLQVNGESTLDYSHWFHLMSRQSDAFKVKQYWDLLQYDEIVKKTDPKTGEEHRYLKFIDLRQETLDGDTSFVQCACGNYVRQEEIESLMDFVPELNIVYPFIHFWQNKIPAPEENEEHVRAYAVFESFDGITYSISRYFNSEYGTWIVELDISNIEGIYVYSWEDTSLLEKNDYVYFENGEKVERENWPEKHWPCAIDVKCVELQYPEKLSRIFFDNFPINDHPPGRYFYDSKICRWKRKVDDMICHTITIEKDSLGWDNRRTLIQRGCIPSDKINLSTNQSKVKFNVVGQGIGYFTIEASEPLTEDVKLTISITNTVERNDSYGLWSEW